MNELSDLTNGKSFDPCMHLTSARYLSEINSICGGGAFATSSFKAYRHVR
jgi:hypothetical protein